MLTKVISGLQTGADIAGIIAAQKCGIEIGECWMPKGFRTEKGPRPEYAQLYNARETASSGYTARTAQNIQSSDGTIIFSRNMNSPGTLQTLSLLTKWGRPKYIPQSNSSQEVINVVEWLKEENIYCLNVAGNRESVAPGIQANVEAFLTKVFTLYFEELKC